MTSPAEADAEEGSTAVVHVADEAGLGRLAALVADGLPDRAFVTLTGDLGAGKTTFVKAIAATIGIDPADVVSPTFGLIHVHPGPRGRLVHADFYRLTGPEELRETGWEQAIAAEAGERCQVFMEWPARIAGLLPADRLEVTIDIDSATSRTLSFVARSPAYGPLIRTLAGRPRA